MHNFRDGVPHHLISARLAQRRLEQGVGNMN